MPKLSLGQHYNQKLRDEMKKLTLSTLVAVILLATLQGCAVQKELIPTGGSRADGTVKLAFQTGVFEKPQIDTAKSLETAKKRCAAWGYTDVEAFGGAGKECIDRNCEHWTVTYQFQCIGTPAASK